MSFRRSKLPKIIPIISLLILLVLGPIVFSLLQNAGKVEAAWMDDAYAYRQRVDITNAGTAQTDFQVAVTLATSTLITAGKMQSDCDDIRITDINGKVLPHWIEESNPGCNQTTTKIWTKVPSVSTTGTTVFLYYGNPSAVNAESPTQVFVFYDNFSSDLSRWTNPASCAGTISSGVLQISTSTGCDSTPMYVTSLAQSDVSGYAMDVRGKFTSGGSDRIQVYQRYRSTNTHMARFWRWGTATYYQEAAPSFGTNTDVGNSGMSADTWYNLSAKVAGTNNTWIVNGTTIGSNVTSAASLLTQTDLTVGLGQYTTTVQYDNVRVRKSATTEPSIASPTNEEKSQAPIAYWKFDEGQGVTAQNSTWKKTGTTTNLMSDNPSLDAGTLGSAPTGWYKDNCDSLVLSADRAVFGSYSGKAVCSGVQSVYSNGRFPLTRNTQYTASAWIYSSVSQSITVEINNLVTGGFSSATTIPANSWTRVTATGSTLDDANNSYVLVIRNAVASTIYIDGTQVEQSSSTTSYCDGTVIGNGSHAWTGTAHASTSTCDAGTNGDINGPSWQTEDQCISGKCLYFDGVNDYVNPNIRYNYSSGISHSFWFRTTYSGGTYDASLISDTDSTASNGIGLGYTSTSSKKIRFFAIQSASTSFDISCNSSALNDGKWHYIATSWDGTTGTNAAKCYIDGIFAGQATPALTIDLASAPLIIGRMPVQALNYTQMFMDDVKIYNYARTAAQIKSDFKSRGTAKGTSASLGSSAKNSDAFSNGLVGYWKMDEPSGSTSTDSSGNGFTANMNSNTFASGKFGNSLNNNGSQGGAYLQYTVGSALDFSQGQSLSIGFWLKVDSLASASRLIGAPATGAWELEYDNNGYTTLNCFSCSGGIGFGNIVTANSTWTHYVITYDGAKANAYKNGALVAGPTATTFGWTSGTKTMNIGGDSPYPLRGSIDEVRIYNRALSPKEIRDLYAFAPGPVGYWNFEEGSGNVNDSSGNGNTGTVTGTAVVSGKYGKARNFNGSSDYIDAGTNSTLGITKAITINAWVKPNSTIDGLARIYTGNGGAFGTDGVTRAWFYIDGTWRYSTDVSASVPTNSWSYWSTTYDSTTREIKIYVNGILKGTTTLSGLSTYDITLTTNNFVIGTAQTKVERFFPGSIDDVRIYNYARNSKQIVEDMNAGHPVGGSPVGSQIAYYKFDEGYGTNTNNSGNGGATYNATLASSPNSPTWNNEGKNGKALNFDGSNDYATINTSLPTLTEGSISMWVKRTATTGTYQMIFTDSGSQFEMAWVNASTLTFYVNNVGISANAASLNIWYYITGTFSETGNYQRIYVNGILASSSTYPGDATTATRYFGSRAGSYPFAGSIDEIKVYNSALTEDEIKLDYNRGQAMVLGTLSDTSGLTGGSIASSSASALYCIPGSTDTCTPPVAEWNFEESTGNPNDSSGNGNNGTWNGTGSHWADGKLGRAGKFNGSDDFVNAGSSLNPSGATAWTMSAWTYNNNGTSLKGIAGWYDGSNGLFIGSKISGDGLIALAGSGSQYGEVSYTTSNTWVYVTAVFDGSQSGNANRLKMYVNGIPQTLSFTGTIPSSIPTLTSAVNRFGETGTLGRYWNGRIDQVRIYNYARSAAQVAWDYNQGKPIAQWKMDECQGASVFDASGNGNTGTITIGATGTQTAVGTCTTSGTAWYNGVTGKFNSSLNFDGTDDYVDMGDGTALHNAIGTGSFSVGIWFKTTVAPAERATMVWKYNPGFLIGIQPAGTVQGTVYQDGSHSAAITSSRAFNDNQFHHAVFIRSTTDSKIYLYVDGQSAATPVSDNTTDLTSNISFALSQTYWQRFSGQLDDVRIYNYALTGTQVKTLFNGGAAVKFGPVTGSP